MNRISVDILWRVATALVLSVSCASAFAQATRTWVSGVGDDANPCSRTAPCKTFAGAISKTAARGEINAIDPGGYGSVTITKAITIDGAGTNASILASGTNGVIVNAGVNDVVVLRNLSINGVETGLNGVRFLAGAALHVENVTVNGFTQEGIEFIPSNAAVLSELFVKDSVLRRNVGTGSGAILVKPGVGALAMATLDNVKMENNQYGLRVEDGATATVRRCDASGNLNNGFLLLGFATTSRLSIDSCNISSNGSLATNGGLKSEGGFAIARISNSMIADNTTGFVTVSGGQIVSLGNNHLAGNGIDGNPTSTIPTR